MSRKALFYRFACRGCTAQHGLRSAIDGELTSRMLAVAAVEMKHKEGCRGPLVPRLDKRPPGPVRILVIPETEEGLFHLAAGTFSGLGDTKIHVESGWGLRLAEVMDHQAVTVEWQEHEGIRFWRTHKS